MQSVQYTIAIQKEPPNFLMHYIKFAVGTNQQIFIPFAPINIVPNFIDFQLTITNKRKPNLIPPASKQRLF